MEEEKKIKPATKKAGMTVKSKKKTAVARAVIRKGKGNIKVNNTNINAYARGYIHELLFEPIRLAGDAIKEYDIDVTVRGSG